MKVNAPTMTDTRKITLRKILLVASILILFFISFASYIIIRESTPRLKKRAVELLEEKLNGDVRLDGFDVSIFPKLQVHGTNLIVHYQGRADIPPLIAIRDFTAQAGFFGVVGKPWKIDFVELKGLVITISHQPADKPAPSSLQKPRNDIPLLIRELVADDAQLIIIPKDTAKSPHIFQIHHLSMNHVGLHRPAIFEAKLENPKPPGEINSQGSFGTWNAEEPGKTPLFANYTFEHADLGVFKGIRGILSSKGKYAGVLDRIEVEGETETPDFTVSSGGHPVNLHTQFSATVDGMNGDTVLHPVNARFLNSTVIANGEVVETPHKKGREIKLDVTVDKGRIEDMLRLAVKTNQPFMTGPVKMNTKFDLPPGEGDVVDRLKLDGTFEIQEAEFTDPQVREKLAMLSRRAKGKPKDKKAGGSTAAIGGRFALKDRIITLQQTTFSIPGASLDFEGTYTLENEGLDFHGLVKMDAKISQTVTGFKSFLLRPLNPFFRKNGATQIPIKILGTRTQPSIKPDFHHRQETK